MHILRHFKTKILIKNIGHPAFTGLAVDSDYGLVCPSQIRWINRQIRHLPDIVLRRLILVHPFINGILMRT